MTIRQFSYYSFTIEKMFNPSSITYNYKTLLNLFKTSEHPA
ncbi:hypothetical protein ABIC84_002322 [Mucilaginibacter sp. 3215]